jgi:hypothetical protein
VVDAPRPSSAATPPGQYSYPVLFDFAAVDSPEDDALFNLSDLLPTNPVASALDADRALADVAAALRAADPDGSRAAAVFRSTFDQLYDGQHTGRYCWDQLYKTEKTHYGTLIEINLRRAFADVIQDGRLLDYQIAGCEVDCKYSHRLGGWMLPPESFDHLILTCTASDAEGTWSMGIVRVSADHRRSSVNRDGKTALNPDGVSAIAWLHRDAELPPNVLLHIDPAITRAIFALPPGQRRVTELFRRVVNRRIGRNTVATAAQQDDYMKRVRANGGARSALREEGYLIAGGDYTAHREVFDRLGAAVPAPGEFVSVRVVPAEPHHLAGVELEGQRWRLARAGEPVTVPAPALPSTKVR